MIKSLQIKNFRCFGSDSPRIEFAPITIIIGPNNSGKSAIIQSLLLLKQTVDSKNDGAVLELTGPFVDFGTYKDIVHRNDLKKHISFSVEVQHKLNSSDKASWSIELASRKAGRQIFARRFTQRISDKITFTAEANTIGEFKKVDIHVDGVGETTIAGSKKITSAFHKSGFGLFPMNPIVLLESFPKTKRYFNRSKRQSQRSFNEIYSKIQPLFDHNELVHEFEGISYIGPLRDSPQRVYSYRGQDVQTVGERGQNTFAILAKYNDKRSKDSNAFWKHLNAWFAKAGLANSIDITGLTPRHFEVRVRAPKSKYFENLSDVGFGTSQVLPVVTESIIRGPGTVHLIEQPEIHLHPRAQSEIGELLLQMKNSKRQAIIETHSFELLVRLRRYLAHGKLKRSDIKFLYVSQNEGAVKVNELHLNENFSFTNWPAGFFEDRVKDSLKILERVSRSK